MSALFQVSSIRGVGSSVQGNEIKLVNEAQGTIMFFNGTKWIILPVGVSGQNLTTQGAAADPVWSGGTGKLILLESGVITAVQTKTFTITATSNMLKLFLRGHSEGSGAGQMNITVNAGTDGAYDFARVIDGTGGTGVNQSQFNITGTNGDNARIYEIDIGSADLDGSPVIMCKAVGGMNTVVITYIGKYDGTEAATTVDEIKLDAASSHTLEYDFELYEVTG